jgi:hypothetical protein
LGQVEKHGTRFQLAIVDLTDTEKILEEEHQTLDTDDQFSELRICIQRLISHYVEHNNCDAVRVADTQLTLLRLKFEEIGSAVDHVSESDTDAICTLEEHLQQVSEIKEELIAIRAPLLSSDVPADDPIMKAHSRLEKVAFDYCLKIKKHLRSTDTTIEAACTTSATKLPKLEPPTFHGDILRWKSF